MARRLGLGSIILLLLVVSFAFSFGSRCYGTARLKDEHEAVASSSNETNEVVLNAPSQLEEQTSEKTPIASKGSSKGGTRSEAGKTIVTTFGSLALAIFAFLGMLAIARFLTSHGRRSSFGHEISITERLRYDAKSELVSLRWRGRLILAVASSTGWRILAEDVVEDEVGDAEDALPAAPQ